MASGESRRPPGAPEEDMYPLGMGHQSTCMDVSSQRGFSWGVVGKHLFMPDRTIESKKNLTSKFSLVSQ